ncbi:MAG TPA: TonB-dependent receptor [Rhizomicrobium sp.]|nr:TonB-dependent receptor [Rhizomicrobium sp.]
MKNYTLGARLLGTSAYAVLLLAAAQSASAQTNDQVETVTVTATKFQAQQIKEAAPNVIDLRLVDEIQQLPDVTLAEALQRIPGVSLETDSGEGRFINIRGMDADLNGTTFDGVRLTASNASTPQGGGRAVAFDAFPSGIMGGVEVVKSLTPDIDAEGLGGIVNILPRTLPSGSDYLLEGELGSGVETLRGSPVWEANVTAGYRFGPRNSMSLVVSYEYHSDWRGLDDLENSGPSTDFNAAGQPIPNDLEFRWYKYHRTRQGLAASYSWDIDANTNVYLRAFDAGYTEYARKHRLEIDNTQDLGAPPMIGNEYQVTDAQFVQNYTDSKETVQNKLIEGGARTTFAGDILADVKLSWTEGDDVSPWSYGFKFTDPNTHPLQYDVTTNPNYPTFQVLDGTDPTNPANYTKIKLDESSSKNQDQEVAAALNVTAPFNFGDVDGSFKFGGSARGRVRRVIGAGNNGVKPTGLSLANFQSTDQIYYDDHYNIGPNANLPALAAIPEDPLVVDPTTYEHDNENVYAGYAQYAGTVGRFGFLGGVRVERTDATYNANIQDSSGNIFPSTNKQSYTNVFPDINGKWQATDDLLIKAAFTTSLARPGFNQITAAKSYDYVNDIVSQGNPDVKATTADNFDLTGDWHTPFGGVASAGLFYKSFSNYIIPTESTAACPTPPMGAGTTFSGPICQFDSFQNIGSATAKGIELSFVQQFTFLPDFWSGFGIDGNFTYAATRGDIRTGEGHALPQTSPRNFNAEVFYEKGPLTLRLAGSYVSTNLWQVGGDATQDLYSQPRFRLDFGGSYKITDNIEWYLEVKNITNTKLEFTQTASSQYPVQREFYNEDFFFGIRAHL